MISSVQRKIQDFSSVPRGAPQARNDRQNAPCGLYYSKSIPASDTPGIPVAAVSHL